MPAQLLAYHTAIAKGTDVDQPRKPCQVGDGGMIAAALARLESEGDPARAADAAAYHKAPRRYLGIPVPRIEELVAEWRDGAALEERVALAAGLWERATSTRRGWPRQSC